MQLTHQGRLLDSSGEPINGERAVTFTILDGADGSLFTETYSALSLAGGYYAVELGAMSNLDTSVFLDHGATHLRIEVDGVSVGVTAMGGYPAVVAHQITVDDRLDAFIEHFVPTSCPSDMTMVNTGTQRAFCVEPTRRLGALYYQDAEAVCASDGRNLCTQTQWFQGATQAGGTGFCGLGSWEWLGTLGERGAADGDLHLIAGSVTDCKNYTWGWTGFGNNQSGPNAYRCCLGQSSAQFR
ncbi:MAG: hypothetical protein ACJATT_003331 [Myxococcota bacterium]|jgi:hypothetical protein